MVSRRDLAEIVWTRPRHGAGWRYQVHRAQHSLAAMLIGYVVSVIVLLVYELLAFGPW